MGKVKERREYNIQIALKEGNWNRITHLLQQEQMNAERRDRYHHKRSLEENISRHDGKQRERHDLVACKTLTPEEALIERERNQAIREAKEVLSPLDRKIVELVAEKGWSYKKTARYISENDKKMSDMTVKSHYLKAIKTLATLLDDYR